MALSSGGWLVLATAVVLGGCRKDTAENSNPKQEPTKTVIPVISPKEVGPQGLGLIKWSMSLNDVKRLGITGLECHILDEGMGAMALGSKTAEVGVRCKWECSTRKPNAEAVPGINGKLTIRSDRDYACSGLDDVAGTAGWLTIACSRSRTLSSGHTIADECDDRGIERWEKETTPVLVKLLGPPTKAGDKDRSPEWTFPKMFVEYQGGSISVTRPDK